MPRDKPIYYISKKRLAWRRAFSIITEIYAWLIFSALAVVAVLIVTDLVFPTPLYLHHTDARPNATKVSLSNIKQALLAFQADCGRYPTAAEGLDALVNVPEPAPSNWHVYMDKVPKDGWGNPFIYKCPGPKGADFDLYSTGEDQIDGTRDDIHLRDLK